MKITSIPQLYRNVRRWREILAVLRRYGMADWLTQFRLPFRDTIKDRGGVPLSQYTREERVRLVLTELGPTFIKLGQILAARPDLVGPGLAEELKKLRADVTPDNIEQVRQTLRCELGDNFSAHFASIDSHPLATASIGQVHRATLNDGTRVVIKVQRSDIERTMRQDVEVISGLAQLAERVEGLAAWGPSRMARQLAPMILRELDFSRERQNLDFFAGVFAKRDSEVVIPRTIHPLCTRRVLVMEELPGQPLSEFLKAEQPSRFAGVGGQTAAAATASENGRVLIDPRTATRQQIKQRLSETIAGAYLTMLFDEALFHADPHAANLLVMDDGRLGILDFGMVGRIDENLRETIEEMLIAISKGDQHRMTRLIRRIGETPPSIDESALAIDAADFISTYGRQSLGNFDLTGALNELSAILHRHSIKLPNQSALLLKMLISLEGTLRELGAGFDSLDVVRRLVRRSLVRRLSPRRRIRQARRIYLEAENFMEAAPDELISLLRQARRGELRMNLEHRRLGPSINRLVLGWMASAVFLGSSLMLAMKVPPLLFHERSFFGLLDLSLLGLLGIVGSMVVMLRLLLAINRSGHLTRDNED